MLTSIYIHILWQVHLSYNSESGIVHVTKTKKKLRDQSFLQLRDQNGDYEIYQTASLRKITHYFYFLLLKYVYIYIYGNFMLKKYIYARNSGSKVFQVGDLVYKVQRIHEEQELSEADLEFLHSMR